MFYKKKRPTASPIIKATKVTICLKCLKHHNTIARGKRCAKCNGFMHTFDSMMEYNRYIDLFHSPNISRLTVQKSFIKGLHVVNYCDGYLTGKEPQFKGYSKHVIERTEYKLDFAYYDNTTYMGWVAEEFKPCPEKMDSETKRKINDAFDQHYKWGHFCYSYPKRNQENKIIKNYKREFLDRVGKQVRYKSFDDMFV